MRVTQQQQCYAAETALDTGRTFASVDEAQAWVDALRDEPWWHLQRFSLAVLRIEVGLIDRRKARRCAGVGWYEKEMSAGRIELDRDALNARVALHEVAHVLASAMYDSTSHDPAWAMTYLTLVSYVLGSEEYLKLQRAFDELGVNYDVVPKSSGVFAL